MRERYAAQVRLLIRLIPFVSAEPGFALKGGTGINLFYRNLPRYSVDIDLTHLSTGDRDASLTAIAAGLGRIAGNINTRLPNAKAQFAPGRSSKETRLLVRARDANVKIEVSPVLRGTLFPPKLTKVNEIVENEFGFAETQVVTFDELYAGKIVAALDRGHPRDLFDIYHLLDIEGISDGLFQAFLVYLISSNRPMHELLDPEPIDIEDSYQRNFKGMATVELPTDVLCAARSRLLGELHRRLEGKAMAFLLAFHDGEPDFDLIGLPQAADLPAVRWKLQNLLKFKDSDPGRHAAQRGALLELTVR